ncbi:MAG TPA: RtcB family protein [Thermoanaerobaculia bacterium]|jgi:tRNA-splicing ligase RtcB|nr:RtcB family protein [Thermoanaerobaculia bacterium]
MKSSELLELGLPRALLPEAFQLIRTLKARGAGDDLRAAFENVMQDPRAATADPELRALAEGVLARPKAHAPREAPAPYRIWGEGLEPGSLLQMKHAADLPVAVRGALMPDAHQGYGLPIGGVLATENAVIPYAVGVDIACRMRLSVFDVEGAEGAFASPVRDRLRAALQDETRFGVGAEFKGKLRRDHPVMEADWQVTPVTAKLRDRAWTQLGTSGSGNHFVEFGLLGIEREGAGLAPGTYLALLSHSGSRGTGATVASHYSKLAKELHPELPAELRNLAWLDLDLSEGQEYWHAMNLMGEYAAANHERIHHHVAQALGFEVLAVVENHHNFAWKEEHDGRELIVHRKGATPAGPGVLGMIPGTMADPAFLVSGLGDPSSLRSASHGAGRRMSRTEARKRFTWEETRALLADRNVELISADIDEAPMAYKDIREVMAAQTDLVEVLGTFHPRLVKMAPAGERPED